MLIKDKNSSKSKILIQDLIFVVLFFLFSYAILKPSIPTESSFWIVFWAGSVGLAMTGIAWISLWMFRLVLIDQIARKKEETSKK